VCVWVCVAGGWRSDQRPGRAAARPSRLQPQRPLAARPAPAAAPWPKLYDASRAVYDASRALHDAFNRLPIGSYSRGGGKSTISHPVRRETEPGFAESSRNQVSLHILVHKNAISSATPVGAPRRAHQRAPGSGQAGFSVLQKHYREPPHRKRCWGNKLSWFDKTTLRPPGAPWRSDPCGEFTDPTGVGPALRPKKPLL
jgi:hypothetical protein